MQSHAWCMLDLPGNFFINTRLIYTVLILKCVIDTKLTVNIFKVQLLYFINPSPTDKTPGIHCAVDGSASDRLRVVFNRKPGNLGFIVHAYVLRWLGIVMARTAQQSKSGKRRAKHETKQ